MKVLILSDTHRQNTKMWQIIEHEKPFDLLVHCGDIEGTDDELYMRAEAPVQIVAGNNDYCYDYEDDKIFNIGKYRVLLTHGHRYHIYRNILPLYYLAKQNNVDIVMFGHIHIPVIETDGSVTLINPGSLTYPRQADRRSTYIIMQTDANGDATYELKYWPEKNEE